MSNQDSWHSQDAFWELFEPVLFNPQRLSSTPGEVDKIEKLLETEERVKILDLSCGKGRHSLEFSRRAYDVIGVDRTAAYIEEARLEAEKLNLKATFVHGDMREYRVPNNAGALRRHRALRRATVAGGHRRIKESPVASIVASTASWRSTAS